jgi:hypothetical protein
MGNLSGFLSQNALKVENVKHIASKRFVDEKQKPIPWEIRGITSTEDEALRKSCTKRVLVPGKRNQYTQETDFNLYLGKLAAACTVYPNLDDAELQNSYGAMGSDSLLKKMLTPGEYADYLTVIQKVNGFEVSFEDSVEEAKN